MVKARLVSISPPAVPLWAVTEEGTLPVLTLALIERETRSSSDGSRYEVRPLFFDRDLGVTPWDEEYGDILGYSLTTLNIDEIKQQFAREIAMMERREARRIAELRKTKAELRERRVAEGLRFQNFSPLKRRKNMTLSKIDPNAVPCAGPDDGLEHAMKNLRKPRQVTLANDAAPKKARSKSKKAKAKKPKTKNIEQVKFTGPKDDIDEVLNKIDLKGQLTIREVRFIELRFVEDMTTDRSMIASIRDIREAHIEDFRDSLPEHLSHKTIFNIMGVLRKLFRDAFRRKDILLLPEFPKIPKGEPVTHWIDEAAQELALAQMQDPVWRVFYLFLMKQGCRPGEARALRWENVDLKNGIVTICAGFDRENFKPYTKERDVRPLPLHPEVWEALANLPRNIAGWVFTYRGQPITQWMASAYWRRAAKKAGVTVSCYEGTRHSLASQAINRGCPDGKISKMLGHKSSASTKRYAKLLSESLKDIWGPSPGDCPLAKKYSG